MLTQYYTPTKVLFGEDAEMHAGEQLKAAGAKKVLVHYGSGSAVKSGLLGKVTDQLDKEGIPYVLLGGVKPNPRLSLVYEGVELSKKEGVDWILAVGGGSVIDSAKAIAYGACDAGDVWDFYSGKRKPEASLPIGVILTLSATGSEMSDSSVISNEDGGLKRGYNNDLCRPRFALLNPALTYSVSPYQTSCGTADIMMHTIERFFHAGKGMELTDNLAMALIRTVMENGRKALDDPNDYDARANLMWASSLSHNGLMQTGNDQRGDWSCHQMEHELSGLFDVAHGAGLAAIWGSWARHVYKTDPSRFALFGEGVFGFARSGSDEADALKTISAMEDYFRSINMPVNMKELGVDASDDDIETLTEKATFFGKRTLGSFMTLQREDIKAIYLAAR